MCVGPGKCGGEEGVKSVNIKAIILGFFVLIFILYWSIVELLFWMHMRNGICPTISVIKDFTVISNCASPLWRGKPWGNSGCENTGYWPQIAPQDQRDDFREPRLLHLPIQRKALNSLTWHTWFSLINSKSFDAEPEAPILWSPAAKSWLIGKNSNAGKDWGEEEKGATEDKMVGWHHRHNGHESEQTLGDSEGRGSLVCCSPWGHGESDMT